MKKIFLLLIMLSVVLCLASCSGGADVPKDGPEVSEDVNPDSIKVESVLGLNEQIYLNLAKGEYVISYKAADAEEYTLLDKELMMENGEKLDCYILGLKKGLYDVKIEQGEGENYACKVLPDIDVEKQDRSGYAHFGREEGIGGYNNDGTVKEGAKILYLTNENKNTVTLDINGTTYTGLAEILQANQYMEEPLIIRVLGKITTNHWKNEQEAPRTKDYSEFTDDDYKNLFSDNQGENIAGITVTFYTSQDGKTYGYRTTRDGIEKYEMTKEEILSPGLLYTRNGNNITVEGVGTDAEFFQFGLGFLYSDSIEIKNITFNKYPLGTVFFEAFGDVTLHGGYWIHHNTFNAGNNNWSDEDHLDIVTVDLADVRNVTVAYNKFFRTGKTILASDWEYDACLNLTFHHNFYLMCEQRLPLSRNANIHNYNNYFADCQRGVSARHYTYLFSEANYFDGVGEAYYEATDEIWGAVKSFGDVYRSSGGVLDSVVKSDSRDAVIDNVCSPDGITDYSKFDTDPELFYYDAENKRSDVEILHEAKDVPDFVPKYAGAGILERMDFPTDAE